MAGTVRAESVTLVVRGAVTVQVDIPRGPPIRHAGRMTVWTGMLTPAECTEVEAVLVDLGLSVSVYRVDPDPRDGVAERESLHVAPPDGEGRLPTIACPTCAWLDVLPGGGFACGVDVWHPAAAAAFNHGKAADDLAQCPASRSRQPNISNRTLNRP